MWNKFEENLKSHDWNYEYSDDHFMWERGNNQRASLDLQFKELSTENKEKALLMWNSFAPDGYKREVINHLFEWYPEGDTAIFWFNKKEVFRLTLCDERATKLAFDIRKWLERFQPHKDAKIIFFKRKKGISVLVEPREYMRKRTIYYNEFYF